MKSPITRAAEAHTNLNLFGVVQSILEGGHLYGGASGPAAQKIIAICKAEMRKHLIAYDKAVEDSTK
ncbi:MAG: hypothetical protein HYX42_00070 [Polaromonas sp.]|uniref:hypothetical protein n=1 Tax=Polaromonas sp. TaxID=1869339 RepID=UPI0025D2CCFA|nr:hypothetical protein [Polaromonas sp.]MBI2724623.1 hypothetical protein [Polaromonas sp.]